MARRDGFSRGLESLEEIRASDRFIEQLRVSGTYEPSTRTEAALAGALLTWRDEARMEPLNPPPTADDVDFDSYAQPRRIARRAVAVAAAMLALSSAAATAIDGDPLRPVRFLVDLGVNVGERIGHPSSNEPSSEGVSEPSAMSNSEDGPGSPPFFEEMQRRLLPKSEAAPSIVALDPEATPTAPDAGTEPPPGITATDEPPAGDASETTPPPDTGTVTSPPPDGQGETTPPPDGQGETTPPPDGQGDGNVDGGVNPGEFGDGTSTPDPSQGPDGSGANNNNPPASAEPSGNPGNQNDQNGGNGQGGGDNGQGGGDNGQGGGDNSQFSSNGAESDQGSFDDHGSWPLIGINPYDLFPGNFEKSHGNGHAYGHYKHLSKHQLAALLKHGHLGKHQRAAINEFLREFRDSGASSDRWGTGSIRWRHS